MTRRGRLPGCEWTTLDEYDALLENPPTVPRGEERFFDRGDILDAELWGRGGGVAIHRNFDLHDDLVGHRKRSGPAFHVFALPDVLREWGARYRLPESWIQPAKDRSPLEHYDVFGGRGDRLVARMKREAEPADQPEAGQQQLTLH